MSLKRSLRSPLRPAALSPLQRALVGGGSGSGSGEPVPSINIDLTSSLDSRITFTRAGSRNYINAGVLTALASSNVPAFESWDGVSRGMAIEPGFTNLLTYSNDFTQAVWSKTEITLSTGDTGSGVMTQLTKVNGTTANNQHGFYRTVSSVSAGTTQTFSCYVKPIAGATTFTVRMHFANEYDNGGVNYHFRVDGNSGFFAYAETATASGVRYGYRKIAGGVYQVWITGTWVSSGTKELAIQITRNAQPDSVWYAGLTTDGFQIYGAQVANTSSPAGYVDTGVATASQAAESAIFNDTSWLASTAQGTFVIEHDCWSGPLIGSGANTVLSATVPGKTAIAWDGSTSDVVNNGGATTASGLPTFSGSDVRLLSTSATQNTGHIKSIRFYASRLSVADLQTLTAKTVVSTATPGVLRSVSVNNRLPAGENVTSGSALTFTSRFKVQLGSTPCSELRLDFPNIRFAALTSVGNALSIDSVALERETGVVEYAPVYVGGSRSFTVANDAAATVVSDAILPAAFTGLTEFPANAVFWVRIKGSVASAGNTIIGSRFTGDAGTFAKIYNPASVSYSPVDGTGDITFVSGTDVGAVTQGYCPILVGKFVTGDPKTIFVVGDSIIEGTFAGETFTRVAAATLGVPQLEMSQGGRGQNDLSVNVASWTPYLKYCRVLVDETGTNNPNAVLDFFPYWRAAKATYGYDKIAKIGLFPRCSSTDNFQTEANQTLQRFYPSSFPDLHAVDLLKYGEIDANLDPQSVRGTNKAKWLTNGTANYTTSDGLHQTSAGNALLATEFQTFLDAITVT